LRDPSDHDVDLTEGLATYMQHVKSYSRPRIKKSCGHLLEAIRIVVVGAGKWISPMNVLRRQCHQRGNRVCQRVLVIMSGY